jgi:hypothetical protein
MVMVGPEAKFGCCCGHVRGTVTSAEPRTVNRVVCYCADCQTFAHWLGRADLLDIHGGSDIVQLAPASMSLSQGQDRVAGVRLTARGLHRFYATCCRTPMGNMVGTSIPFVGVAADAFRIDGQNPDVVFGRPLGAIRGEYAVGGTPRGSKGLSLRLVTRSIAKVFCWRLAGRTWPHPFVDRTTGKIMFPETTLTPGEREQIRAICGPRP